jgi:N6-L-threonylcarbamoyladenine synthase
MTTILALETSCDETAVAVVRDRQVLSSVVSSQIEIHQPYGGIVPEVASRQHVVTIGAEITAALDQAQVDLGADRWGCRHLCAGFGGGTDGGLNGW